MNERYMNEWTEPQCREGLWIIIIIMIILKNKNENLWKGKRKQKLNEMAPDIESAVFLFVSHSIDDARIIKQQLTAYGVRVVKGWK